MDPLLLASATKLAEMIRRGEVSSAEVVERHIRQVEKVNPSLNAMVATRFDEAMREARAADERLAKEGDRAGVPPFFGVPCSIKETFALTGMPLTGGLVARRHRRADKDAEGVRKLREAGAIPLGVTNISELCMWMESNNKVYGRSNNPYDLTRTTGGSSGGEGAMVGAGAAPFGLGADIGGSIRMPAFFNGVFGHKPTGGLVDNAGQFPVPAPGAMGYLTTGPLARKAEDLAPLLGVLAAPNAVGDPAGVSVAGLSVVSIEDNGRVGVSDELRAAQERAASALSSQGARVRKARIKALESSLEIWSSMLEAAAGPSFSSMLGEGTEIAPAWELLKWALGRSPYTLPALGLALVEKIPKAFPSYGRRFIALGKELRRELVELIGPTGVLLYPPYATTAPKHGRAMLPPINWMYTAVLNVMEVPVTQVPLGLGRDRLPLGVQVVASHGNDHVTIAVARALEGTFGGWVPPGSAS